MVSLVSSLALLLAPLGLITPSNAFLTPSPPTPLHNHPATSLHATTDPNFGNVGFLLLAGGTGSRMKSSIPKQFLPLRSVPVLHHSLHLLLETLPHHCSQHGLTPPAAVVLVLDPLYREDYRGIATKYPILSFANPGTDRQDSVRNGLLVLSAVSDTAVEYVAVHDSARPLVTLAELLAVVSDAKEYGAAVLGVPCKPTIKESDDGVFVSKTLDRTKLWEVHTPQVVGREDLMKGMKRAQLEGWSVTDDVSIVEGMGGRVKLTRGEYTNLKITTPEDMDVAEAILRERGVGDDDVRLLD